KHDTLTRFETFENVDASSDQFPYFNRSLRCLVIRAYYPSKIFALQLRNASLWHQNAPGSHPEVHSHPSKHSGAKRFLGIRKLGPHPQRSCFDVHRTVNKNNFPRLGMLGTIRKHKFERQFSQLLTSAAQLSIRLEIIHLANRAIKPNRIQ